MKASEQLIEAIKQFEGIRSTAYPHDCNMAVEEGKYYREGGLKLIDRSCA